MDFILLYTGRVLPVKLEKEKRQVLIAKNLFVENLVTLRSADNSSCRGLTLLGKVNL